MKNHRGIVVDARSYYESEAANAGFDKLLPFVRQSRCENTLNPMLG